VSLPPANDDRLAATTVQGLDPGRRPPTTTRANPTDNDRARTTPDGPAAAVTGDATGGDSGHRNRPDPRNRNVRG